jgi:predicted component of type VI protein secretion system
LPISAYEFDASAQDVALLRNISKVSAAAHMPFIGSAGPTFFLKESMEDVAAIKDIGNYFDRAEYIKWKAFREFGFANPGFTPLSDYKNQDYTCFFSANFTHKPALHDTADATASSRIIRR